jgi:hypothetical protein
MHFILWIHIALMATAAALVLSAAVTARKKKDGWLLRHRSRALAGSLCAVAGFAAMFFFKLSVGYPHFQSPHAIAGLAGAALLVLTPVLGALLVSGKAGLAPVHRAFGRMTAFMVLASVIMGVFRVVQIFKR